MPNLEQITYLSFFTRIFIPNPNALPKVLISYSQMDLMPFINKAGCECLNESDEHGFDNCLRKDMTFLESDCDEQVMECRG